MATVPRSNSLSPVTALTAVASRAYEMGNAGSPWPADLDAGDPLLTALAMASTAVPPTMPEFQEAVEALAADPDLAVFAPRPGELDPMILTATGGFRQSFDLIIHSLISAALRRLTFLGDEITEATLTTAVIANYEELRRAARGQKFQSYMAFGLAGATLPAGEQISTPWGTLRNAPAAKDAPVTFGPPRIPQATATLITPVLLEAVITREFNPGPLPVDQSLLEGAKKARTLLPLSIALATVSDAPCAPIVTFQTSLPPFSMGFTYQWDPQANLFLHNVELNPGHLASIEEWARRVGRQHNDSLQVAANRVVSAISQRRDKADTLIDAVTAWESLVGTSSETGFRVTAALTILLESDPIKRPKYRQELNDIYSARSRVVHGNTVEPAKLRSFADDAVRVALLALRAIYEKGGDWPTIDSVQRAERLLLGLK